MANNIREIKYLNKDFNSLRSQLEEYAKNYFPDSYSDFSGASPGGMFMEMVAYVGDILSFYQDIQVQETFLQYAKNPASLYNIAYMMGYRPKCTSTSEVELTFTQIVSASLVSGSYVPDWSQACRIEEYSEVGSESYPNISFLTRKVVDFNYSSSYDPTDVEIVELDSSGNPTKYSLTKKVTAFSGKTKTITKDFGTYQKYQTFEIPDDNIIAVTKAIDSSGDEWREVPYLGQDTVFVAEAVTGSIEAASILKLVSVPKRFVTRLNSKGRLGVQFGAGMNVSDETPFLPNPITLEENADKKIVNKYDTAYDPSNFLFTRGYGLAPVNTRITFSYLVGGGVSSNVPANSLTDLSKIKVSRPTGTTLDLYVNNEKPASGGRGKDSAEDIRQNALRSFAEQKRVVTLDDFNVRALAMPTEFGSVSKTYTTRGLARTNRQSSNLLMYVLSYNSEGKLVQTNDTVKNNLKTYLSEYTMLSDTIDIQDAYIINIGVRYEIALRKGYNINDVLNSCSKALAELFKTDNRNINETINLSEAYSTLSGIQGVQVVKNIELYNKVGNGYSEYAYDVTNALRDSVLYPSYDPCIFEVKYPEVDIEGRVTVL